MQKKHILLALTSSALFSSILFAEVNFDKKRPAQIVVNGVHLDTNLPHDQMELIVLDLDYIQNKNINILDDDLAKIFKIRNNDIESFRHILFERVKHITGESLVMEENLMSAPYVKVSYPNKVPLFTDTPSPYGVPGKPESSGSGKSYTVMSNMGAGIYSIGKKSDKYLILKMNDKSVVEVPTPRAGVIQVGEGLFLKELQVDKDDNYSEANVINRLMTYYHEGRHSDGNGSSLMFGHIKCPKGHMMEGVYACDANLNGPYTVGALVGKTLIKSCESCKEKDKETLNLKIAGLFDRIVGTNAATLDNIRARLEKNEKLLIKLTKLKNENKFKDNDEKEYVDFALGKVPSIIDRCKMELANPDKFKITEWDDTPEEATIQNEDDDIGSKLIKGKKKPWWKFWGK